MEATNLGWCKLSWKQVFKNLTTRRAKRCMVRRTRCEAGHDHEDRSGRSVDESMIVLRLRIKEMKMKMLEGNQEAPSDWMEWEKQYCACYDNDVFEAMGLLQSYLMELRPSVALGMLVFVALSVLMCSGMGLFLALEIAKSFISCFGSR